MAESFEIGSLEHGGMRTLIGIEEGKNFRRINIARYRLVFGEARKMGEVHVYMDEVESFLALVEEASRTLKEVAYGEGWEGLTRLRL
jgi:hypothetical protein